MAPCGRCVPSRFHQSLPGDKAHKLAALLDVAGPDDLYRRLLSQWPDPSRVVIEGRENDCRRTSSEARALVPGFTERMMLLDLTGYLPGDILVKVDRASMAVSLEARAPLLDHRLIEWAWRLPLAFKRRDRTGKWMLRQLLYRYVPPSSSSGRKWASASRSTLAARSAARLGVVAHRAGPAEPRGRAAARAHPSVWARPSERPAQPPAPALGGADVPGLARRVVCYNLSRCCYDGVTVLTSVAPLHA